MLRLNDVEISYKNVPTVQDFNLEMKQGQIVSLVGESGSGKTTVIRAILGLIASGGKVTKGEITFEGKNLLAYMSDYIIVMKHGRIEDQGSREHILHHSDNEYTRKLLYAVPSLGGERYV